MVFEKRAFIFIGPPGSGKTTVAKTITGESRSVAHIDTGLMLRLESVQNAERGGEIRPYIENGELVPTPLVMELLDRTLESVGEESIIFDGFPQKIEQIKSFTVLGEKYGYDLAAVFIFDAPRKTAVDRIMHRGAGSPFTAEKTRSNTPEEQAEEKEAALDMNRDRAEKRYEIYEREVEPVAAYFEANFQKITKRITADRSFEEVVDVVRSALSRAGYLIPGEKSGDA